MTKRIYVSGPYTDNHPECVEYNVASAKAYGHTLIKMGCAPFIPHMNHYMKQPYPELTYEDYLEWDLAFLDTCDAIFVLSDIRHHGDPSAGTLREIEQAKKNGMPVFRDLKAVEEWLKDLP